MPKSGQTAADALEHLVIDHYAEPGITPQESLKRRYTRDFAMVFIGALRQSNGDDIAAAIGALIKVTAMAIILVVRGKDSQKDALDAIAREVAAGYEFGAALQEAHGGSFKRHAL